MSLFSSQYMHMYNLLPLYLLQETDSSVGGGTGSGGGEEVHQVQSPVPQRSSANSVKYKLRQKRRRTRSSAEVRLESCPSSSTRTICSRIQ